ncbi:type VII secretion-associated serine protease mycosin [Mycobacteroides abscessus subsp. abscessus]|nr:type VII secretion-associated serine protease mycosin [Mycobacteroides abscessus subsp. abscessus]
MAVFDGGVDASSPIWQGKVISKQLGTVTGSLTAQRHGALVTSAMLYGHLDGMTLPEPANIEITHYTSIPQAGYEHDVQMYWLLDTMKREIERGDFEVVLLCVGPDLIVADDYVDRWTSVIDQLAFEQDVLFVIAAGNNGALDPGLNRILVPADTANGIAVGASATQHRARRAPYSARGPGRSSYQIRPSGIAFGGSEAERFIAVDNDGEALAFQGTSCAAPLVVHGLAKAAARLGLQYRSALTLRCCAIHFAAPAPKSRSNEEGYGYLPHEYPLLDDTEPNCVHVLYQGEAQRNRIEALPLPLPSCACAPLKLRITLISVSDVNSHDAGDYAGAGFDVTLRPDSRLHSYTLSRPGESEHVVRNVSDDDLERCQELHEKGYRKSGRADSENWTVRNKHENVRRGDGKWESVQVITHGFKKNPHKPVIELEHLSRLDGRLTAEESPLKWTMLVTLQGAANANLYDEVVQEFPTLQPLPEHGPESDGGFVEV